MNKPNKLTRKWIKSQPCYYNEHGYIAEGYCNRTADIVYQGHYVCYKCVKIRKKTIVKYLVISFALLLTSGLSFFLKDSNAIFFIIWIVSFYKFISYSIREFPDSYYYYKGQLEEYDKYLSCQHCPDKYFLLQDKKKFLNHLKNEHSKDWEKISKELNKYQSFSPTVIKIETRKILREYVKHHEIIGTCTIN